MRFYTAAVAFFASVVLAQNNAISIPEGQSTLDVTAGQPQTITWTNPSSGTVTIKLQDVNGDIRPDSGVVIASAINAADGTATFTIPADEVAAAGDYTIQIVDDSNANNYNFSPTFSVAGAEGSGSLPSGTASETLTYTTGSATTSETDSSSTTSETDSSSTTDVSSTTESSTATESTTSTRTTSRTSSSTEPTAESTSAPDSSNSGAGAFRVQGGLVAAIAAAVALL